MIRRKVFGGVLERARLLITATRFIRARSVPGSHAPRFMSGWRSSSLRRGVCVLRLPSRQLLLDLVGVRSKPGQRQEVGGLRDQAAGLRKLPVERFLLCAVHVDTPTSNPEAIYGARRKTFSMEHLDYLNGLPWLLAILLDPRATKYPRTVAAAAPWGGRPASAFRLGGQEGDEVHDELFGRALSLDVTNYLYNHVVMDDLLSIRFAALADPTRRGILARLALGEATVGELSQPFKISQPAISKHLRVLEQAGLIEKGQTAQKRPRRLNVVALKDATDWISSIDNLWRDSFDRLDAFLVANPDIKTNKGE
jgi:DNA-binding transcriptional ArsR family regulator